MSHDKKKQAHGHSETPSDEVTLPKQDYEELLKRVAELDSLKDRLLHSAADFENAKKRLTRERDEYVKFSQENLIRDLLPVLDNFERALAHAGEGDSANSKGIVAGVEMVRKQLFDALKNQGLKRLQAVGEVFDPHEHEAVGFVHEPGPENIIVEEVQPGYRLHDRLLRAAKVRIRTIPAPGDSQEEIT
jgi:molecular chaperone GrpE